MNWAFLSRAGNENYLTLTIIVYEMECQPPTGQALEIVVNGEARRAPAGQTILGLLDELRQREREGHAGPPRRLG